MTRSFLCPPSGYARNWDNSQNLVESTKIKRDIVESKTAFGKDKEKKEKKRNKKESNRKSRKSLKEEFQPCQKIHEESEQLEKSGLTEELEQPHNLCYLSDGTQSSNKRKRAESPPTQSVIKAVPGKPLKIRLVLRKPTKQPEAIPEEERACSTHEPIQDENLPSTSRGEEGAVAAIDTKKKKHKRSRELRYDELFNDLFPQAISYDDEADDDWLFGSRREHQSTAKTAQMDEDINMNMNRTSGDSCFPKAQFLPEVGIYSMPYSFMF